MFMATCFDAEKLHQEATVPASAKLSPWSLNPN